MVSAILCTGVQLTFLTTEVPALELNPLELLVTEPAESVFRFTCETLLREARARVVGN